jgi:hypothetical protein
LAFAGGVRQLCSAMTVKKKALRRLDRRPYRQLSVRTVRES